MKDRPFFGGVLFVIGTVLVGLAYFGADAPPLQLFDSSVGVYTGVVSACRKLGRAMKKTMKTRFPDGVKYVQASVQV
jgi:hypothetical protein